MPRRCSIDSHSPRSSGYENKEFVRAVRCGALESVPSRISVVLVEEAEVKGAECLASPRVDKDL